MHKALGRGLESLLPATPMPAAAQAAGETVLSVPISKVKPNRYQPRHVFDEQKLGELAESIKQNGLAQPLLVSPSAIPGEYELIAGERRLRACKMAGLSDISVIVKQTNDKERFQLSLIENIQREDLNAIEEAKAYKRLGHEFNHTQEELAVILGKDRSVVANSLRLLNLPQEIQDSIAMGAISPGHGRILAGIGDQNKLGMLADRILKEKLTVREVEKIVGDWKSVISGVKKKASKLDAALSGLCEELQRKYSTKVKIVGKPQKGRIEIHYFSLKELERVSSMLRSKKH